jgi:hypothetical protein
MAVSFSKAAAESCSKMTEEGDRKLILWGDSQGLVWYCSRCCWQRVQSDRAGATVAHEQSVRTEFDAHCCEDYPPVRLQEQHE